MNKEDLQKKYIELQFLEQQSQQIQQQLLVLGDQLGNLEKTKETIDDIKSVKLDSEVFLPLGIGIYASGLLKDNKSLLVNVGSNVAVKKTITESKDFVEKQIKEINNIIKQLENILIQASHQSHSLKHEIEHLMSKEEQH